MDKIIHLSITKKTVPVRVDVVQYTTAPNIVFVLDDYVPTGTATIYIEKPSGHKVFNSCEIVGNAVRFTPTTQAFAEKGTNEAQLRIIDGESEAQSFLIFFDVTESIIDDTAIESTDEFTALEEALADVAEYDRRWDNQDWRNSRFEYDIVRINGNIQQINDDLEPFKALYGTDIIFSNTDNDSIPSSETRTNVNQITLSKGSWLVMGYGQFQTSGNGRREITLSTTPEGSQATRFLYDRTAGSSATQAVLRFMGIINISQATYTYYLNALQTSGTTLTFGSGLIAMKVR